MLRCCRRSLSCQTHWQSSLYTYQWMGQHEKEWKNKLDHLIPWWEPTEERPRFWSLKFPKDLSFLNLLSHLTFYLTWLFSVGQIDIEVYMKMHPPGRHIAVNLPPLQKTIQILYNWRLWSWKHVSCFFLFTSFGKTIPLFQPLYKQQLWPTQNKLILKPNPKVRVPQSLQGKGWINKQIQQYSLKWNNRFCWMKKEMLIWGSNLVI